MGQLSILIRLYDLSWMYIQLANEKIMSFLAQFDIFATEKRIDITINWQICTLLWKLIWFFCEFLEIKTNSFSGSLQQCNQTYLLYNSRCSKFTSFDWSNFITFFWRYNFWASVWHLGVIQPTFSWTYSHDFPHKRYVAVGQHRKI